MNLEVHWSFKRGGGEGGSVVRVGDLERSRPLVSGLGKGDLFFFHKTAFTAWPNAIVIAFKRDYWRAKSAEVQAHTEQKAVYIFSNTLYVRSRAVMTS